MANFFPSTYQTEFDITNSNEWPALISPVKRHVAETYPGEHMTIEVAPFDSVMKAFALTLKPSSKNESTLKKSSAKKCLCRSHHNTYQRQNEFVAVGTSDSQEP